MVGSDFLLQAVSDNAQNATKTNVAYLDKLNGINPHKRM
jgi:hypothetical protein